MRLRRETLPRVRPAPEVNIIQRPELLRRLQRFLGLRQAHIAPALNEGVQPVVVLGTITDAPGTEAGGYASAEGVCTSDATNMACAIFDNPPGSGTKARIDWFQIAVLASAATPQFLDVRWTTSSAQPPVFPMLLAPDNDGGRWEDGDVTGMAKQAALVGNIISPTWPKNQGSTKCQLYVGKQPALLPNAGNLYHMNMENAAASPWRIQERRPRNVWVYPAEELVWYFPLAVGVGNSFSIELEWFEQPVGGGEGSP